MAVVDDAGADAALGDDSEVAGVGLPVTVIRTTAGLTLAATAMVAEDSSIVTGWTAPTFVPGRPRRRARSGRVRRRAPSASDGAAGGEDRRQQRDGDDRPPARRDGVGAGRLRGAGGGGRLVPALGGRRGGASAGASTRAARSGVGE